MFVYAFTGLNQRMFGNKEESKVVTSCMMTSLGNPLESNWPCLQDNGAPQALRIMSETPAGCNRLILYRSIKKPKNPGWIKNDVRWRVVREEGC